ncbi:MAG TPA: hypothetical protein VFM29_03105, partial [Vicinamibacteria bacterium]|nr:hypothetical protein [Vicinamibacteria bacterium]
MSARRAPLVHWSVVAVLVLLLPVAFLTWRAFGSWRAAQTRVAELEGEGARLKASNAVLARA